MTGSDDYTVPASDKASGVTASNITVNGQKVTVTVEAASVADVVNLSYSLERTVLGESSCNKCK